VVVAVELVLLEITLGILEVHQVELEQTEVHLYLEQRYKHVNQEILVRLVLEMLEDLILEQRDKQLQLLQVVAELEV
tara:strand:- start:303 stop:533 length:231 start_codon:yes stop_codon:yes gene_type:complete